MFDDFVEHAGTSSTQPAFGGISASSPSNRYEDVSYEGFEQTVSSDDDEDDEYGISRGAAIESLETGYISTHHASGSSSSTPIFTLGHVQFTVPSRLLHLRVCSNTLFMALTPLTLILIDLANSDQLQTIELPPPKPVKGEGGAAKSVITGIWPDSAGKHLLVGTSGGDAWYLSSVTPEAGYPIGPGEWKKPKAPLKSLKSSSTNTLTSACWSPPPTSSSARQAPRDVLVGTSQGQVHCLALQSSEDLFKSQEREFVTLWSGAEKSPVVGLGWGGGADAGKKDKAWLVAVQKNGKGWEAVVGKEGGKWVEEMAKGLKDGGGMKPIELQTSASSSASPAASKVPSELHFYNSTPAETPSSRAMSWLTPHGIYHTPLASSPNSSLFASPAVLPFPTTSSPSLQTPISMTVTRYHYLLLYADRVCAVGRLDERLVWEERLPLKGDEKALGLNSDPSDKTHWLYTSQAIFELVVSDEDRDVWRIMLKREEYEPSLKFAKTPQQKDLILSAQADAFFAQGRFHQAAAKYALCSKSFEEVVLRFVDVGERDAMRYYLNSRLDGLKKTDLTQRMMIATWLVEIYLSKCNTLEDVVAAEAGSQDVESLKLERTMVEEELRQFLKDYQLNLDRKTVYDLFLSHGRTDLYIFFATTVKDYAKVVEHWVMEEEWVKAIEVLNRQSSPDLHYRFSPVLMRNAPRETVDSWLRSSALDPRRLIPALLQQQHRRRDPMSPNHAVRYLNHVIFTSHSTDPTVHNLLVTFYCSDPNPDDGPLLRFLAASPDDPTTERPYFDLDYALRLCMKHSRVQPCVHIYSKMGLYESSVDLALEKGDLELAKINADKPVDDELLRKKLWLKIAKYVVQDKKDIKTAMRFLDATDLIKIDDILPFFPDFVVIDEFKEEICMALEACGTHISQLKAEMDDATQSAEAIKRDIAELQNRFITIEPEETCSHCDGLLMQRQFYVFPCLHAFHADCLITLIKEFAPSTTLRRILALQTALLKLQPPPSSSSLPPNSARALLSSSSTSSPLVPNRLAQAGDRLRELIVPDALASAISGSSSGKKSSAAKKLDGDANGEGGKGGKKAEKMREELDDLLAGSCVLCDSVVVGLDRPFVGDGEGKEWEV